MLLTEFKNFEAMHEKISSLQNARIKNVVKLQEKSQERRSQGLFVVEGEKEIEKLLGSGLKINSVFACPEVLSMEIPQGDFPVFEVSREVFGKIAYREGSAGVVVLVHEPEPDIHSLFNKNNPLFIVLESVEKPGNLGAILRTADAAGADGVIICEPRTDVWNPNVIRSSLGCVFTVPVLASSSEEVYKLLRKNNVKVLAAALKENAIAYTAVDLTVPSAIVLGTEADGLSDFWLGQADAVIIIPMAGKVDSLNVSTSAAILVFEAVRQRGSARR